jgi:membrane fusion protein, heavy metal efflux system
VKAYHLLLLLLVTSTLSSCSGEIKIPEVKAEAALLPKGSTQVELKPAQEQQIGLIIGSANVRPFPVTVQTTGQLQEASDLSAHISTPVAGRVVSISINRGQQVVAGQALAVLKSDAVGQIQADLLQATLQNESDIRQAQVQINFSKATYQRELKLFKDRISSQADLEAARTQFDKDQAALEALQAKGQATITTAQERLSLYGVAPGVAAGVVRNRRINPFVTISAPRSGVITNRTINIGELADPTKDMFTLADLSRVWLVADIYEKDISKVRIGQPVDLTLDSLGGKHFPGKVSYVANELDPQTRTLVLRADVPNPGLNLKPDMFARVNVRVGDTSVLSVPREALQRNGDYTFAYVPVGPHRYEERQVEIGMDDGTYVQITKGLKAGEKVVTRGTLPLQGEALKKAGGIE